MKKIRLIFLFSFLLLAYFVNAQKIDKIVYKKIYTSYYSYDLHAPLYVVYKLYKGGGSAKRSNFFEEYGTAKSRDYKKSGYDRGHLVSAEDFAFNQAYEKLTFSYYNCFPQSSKLNKGPWKSWEYKIRQESQKWPLKIYVGGIYSDKKLNNRVSVPKYCWKVVYNLKTKLIMHVLLFENDAKASAVRVNLSKLKQMLGYQVDFNMN